MCGTPLSLDAGRAGKACELHGNVASNGLRFAPDDKLCGGCVTTNAGCSLNFELVWALCPSVLVRGAAASPQPLLPTAEASSGGGLPSSLLYLTILAKQTWRPNEDSIDVALPNVETGQLCANFRP